MESQQPELAVGVATITKLVWQQSLALPAHRRRRLVGWRRAGEYCPGYRVHYENCVFCVLLPGLCCFLSAPTVIYVFFLINVSHLFSFMLLFLCYFPDYDTNKTVKCSSEYVYDESRQRSLQHFIEFEPLADKDLSVVLPSGAYAACGFQIRLVRKTMQYLVQVYLPSCMFVVVSWVSFLIKPEVVPGRMALLVTLFLVLINIFNSVR